MIATNFSVRLTPQERQALERLAQESGRTPGGVVRRLLALAELPEAKRLLGLPANDPTRLATPQEVIT